MFVGLAVSLGSNEAGDISMCNDACTPAGSMEGVEGAEEVEVEASLRSLRSRSNLVLSRMSLWPASCPAPWGWAKRLDCAESHFLLAADLGC